MQLLNNTQKTLTSSSAHREAGAKDFITGEDGKHKPEGNLVSATVLLEVKNLHPRGRGHYTRQAACLMPPPDLEATVMEHKCTVGLC